MFKKIMALLLALMLVLGTASVAYATGAEPEQPGTETEEPEPQPEPEPEPAVYTVTFDTDGGSAVDSQSVTEGETAAQPADPVREGYVFDGWFADAGRETAFDFSVPVYADLTVYAGWTESALPVIVDVTVTFDSAGGSPVATQTIRSGEKAIPPTNPVREGYTFRGWELDGVGYDFSEPVESNITLLAVWEEDKPDVTYTVTFQTNGGSAVSDQIVTEGNTPVRPADPTRDGYTFDGWFTDSGLAIAFDFSKPVTGNNTVYARWKPISVQPVTPTSVDIRLSYLSIECGELHPAFSPDIYSYTVYVTADQENRSCRILCDTLSHEARVEAEGPRTVGNTDVVRKVRVAGGGRYAEYTVVVHVLTFRERIWDDELYSITDRPNTSVLPGTFTVGQITINGEKVSAAQSTDGQMLLVQFTSQADGSGSHWYRYEQASGKLYPVSIVEVDRDHFIRMDEGSELLYGSEAGVGTFYVYNPDTGEITYQTKDYDELSVQLIPSVVEKNAPNWPIVIALGAWGAIATAAAYYLLRRSRREKKKSVYFRPVFSAEADSAAPGSSEAESAEPKGETP